jgi:hypothetical protein
VPQIATLMTFQVIGRFPSLRTFLLGRSDLDYSRSLFRCRSEKVFHQNVQKANGFEVI